MTDAPFSPYGDVQTLDLKWVTYSVENRHGMWYVTYPSIGREMAPVFQRMDTAMEIGQRSFRGDAFFDRIPNVPLGSPYPRPGIAPDGQR